VCWFSAVMTSSACGSATWRLVMSAVMRRLDVPLWIERIRSPMRPASMSAVRWSAEGARSSITQIGVRATACSVEAMVSLAAPGSRFSDQIPGRGCHPAITNEAVNDLPPPRAPVM